MDEQESGQQQAQETPASAEDSIAAANSAFERELAGLLQDEPTTAPDPEPTAPPEAGPTTPDVAAPTETPAPPPPASGYPARERGPDGRFVPAAPAEPPAAAPEPPAAPAVPPEMAAELEQLRQFRAQAEARARAQAEAEQQRQAAAIIEQLRYMTPENQQATMTALAAQAAIEQAQAREASAAQAEARLQAAAKVEVAHIIGSRSGIDPRELMGFSTAEQMEAMERTVLAERQAGEARRRDTVQHERAASGADAFGRGTGGGAAPRSIPQTTEEANAQFAVEMTRILQRT